MSTKIGQFEILSELAKSPTGLVYKANDPESGQTVALKAIQMSAFGDSAEALEQALLAEAESSKVLSSPNITKVFGAGKIDGVFCAAMEYVQGNSIATMLARKEGFSIWDLLDIGRQLCSGLDHASSHHLVHYSLEPAKIMCGWDGTVKILSFGISSVGNFAQHVNDGVPSFVHYMSPEQVRGDATDGRSNLYTLGAMFYEMVTERKAFDREDLESLRQGILESTPVAPAHVNPKIHPLLSNLIMKALAKDPAQRYQNGRELLDDLEKCKESKPAAAKKAEAPKGLVVPNSTKAAAQTKFVSTGAPKQAAPAAASKPAPTAARPSAPLAPSQPKTLSATPRTTPVAAAEVRPALAKPSKLAMPKAAAAAAGIGASEGTLPAPQASPAFEVQELDLSDQFVTPASPTMESEQPYATMSAAVADEPQVETFEPQGQEDGPKIAVDPMMAEGGAVASSGTSFSDIAELPPLKEAYVPPAPPPPVEVSQAPAAAQVATYRSTRRVDEKPKIQPREVAQKAIKEIKGVPPKLMFYALGAAGVLILVIGIAVTLYIHSQNSDDDAGAPRAVAVTPTSDQPETSPPAPKQEPAPAPAPVASQPVEVPEAAAAEPEPTGPAKPRGANKKRGAAAPLVIPGQLAVDSTPQGAQVQVDGASDPSWVTPFALTNLKPGQHSITVSKAGYSSDSRTINVTSGNRATASIRLAQLMATLVVKSDPPGASVYVDGRNMSAKTPAQVSVDKGQHVVLVRMSGYLDETITTQFTLGQTFSFSPTLRQLGNVDSIKTVGGKMSRLFGGKNSQPGQGTLSIRTQPKGAQIAINQHMLDKNSPVDVSLDPGSYEVDITLSGYAPVRKVITAGKGEKVVIDEALQQQ
ncbi:MAG TPA: serine/threonine-protein kinase [Candidatus Dormibacteraeota bacterium]|nr:serine/threonine-protein kinase [Candidatus Dormibacteraeota bacterium]